jgi:HAMP domain-containing protein
MASPMGLRAKFNLAIVIAFLVGFTVTGFLLLHRFEANARSDAIQNARVMMASANAIRYYTSHTITPLIGVEREGAFLLASVPAFAAQSHFQAIQYEFPDYSYKEAVVNPTNLAHRTTDWEADVVAFFRGHQNQHEFIAERDTPSGRLLSLAHPISVTEGACLACHSAPGDAPSSMRKLYGDANGFGWQVGDIIGAQIISVSMDNSLAQAHQTLKTFLLLIFGVFVLMIVILNALLHYAVIRPVIEISGIATEVSMGSPGAKQFNISGDDEMALLSKAFNRMRRSLEHAMKLLDEEGEGSAAGGAEEIRAR